MKNARVASPRRFSSATIRPNLGIPFGGYEGDHWRQPNYQPTANQRTPYEVFFIPGSVGLRITDREISARISCYRRPRAAGGTFHEQQDVVHVDLDLLDQLISKTTSSLMASFSASSVLRAGVQIEVSLRVVLPRRSVSSRYR